MLLETRTYRMKGHAEHDHQGYVPAEELAAWSLRDPIATFSRRLIDSGEASASDLEEIDRSIRAEVEREAEAAETSPLPEPGTALEGVYAPATAETAILRRLG